MNRRIVEFLRYGSAWEKGSVWLPGGPSLDLADSGDSVELDGRTVVESLPLDRSGSVRYFKRLDSGWRSATPTIPPSHWKLEFSGEESPFWLEWRSPFDPEKGEPPISIPGDHATARGRSSIFRPAPITSQRFMRTYLRLLL